MNADSSLGLAKLPVAAANAPSTPDALTGQWIWSCPEGSGAVPKAGEAIALRRIIDLKEVQVRAVGVITCDNSYILYVNNQKVADDEAWDTVEAVSLERHLRVGKNEFFAEQQEVAMTLQPKWRFSRVAPSTKRCGERVSVVRTKCAVGFVTHFRGTRLGRPDGSAGGRRCFTPVRPA